MSYPNVSSVMGTLISGGMATITELSTTASLEDAYTLLEIMAIDAYNSRPE